MSKLVAIVAIVALAAGCAASIGSGTAYGYVEGVGEEWGTPMAYIKSSLESSKSDIYCVKNDSALLDSLNKFAASGVRVKLQYETALCFIDGGSEKNPREIEGRIVSASAV